MRLTICVLALAIGLAVSPSSADASYEVLWSLSHQEDFFRGQLVTIQNLIGDIDGDGALEIVGLSADKRSIKIADSSSGYVELTLVSPLGYWGYFSLFDIDGDGKLEVIADAYSGVGGAQDLVAIGFLGVAGVSDEQGAPSVSLLSVSPNPFNRSISFRLDVRTHSNVRIQLFDLAGRMVKVACDQACEPGVAALNWDGTTLQGNLAASGVYFYRVEADGALIKADKLVIAR